MIASFTGPQQGSISKGFLHITVQQKGGPTKSINRNWVADQHHSRKSLCYYCSIAAFFHYAEHRSTCFPFNERRDRNFCNVASAAAIRQCIFRRRVHFFFDLLTYCYAMLPPSQQTLMFDNAVRWRLSTLTFDGQRNSATIKQTLTLHYIFYPFAELS